MRKRRVVYCMLSSTDEDVRARILFVARHLHRRALVDGALGLTADTESAQAMDYEVPILDKSEGAWGRSGGVGLSLRWSAADFEAFATRPAVGFEAPLMFPLGMGFVGRWAMREWWMAMTTIRTRRSVRR